MVEDLGFGGAFLGGFWAILWWGLEFGGGGVIGEKKKRMEVMEGFVGGGLCGWWRDAYHGGGVRARADSSLGHAPRTAP